MAYIKSPFIATVDEEGYRRLDLSIELDESKDKVVGLTVYKKNENTEEWDSITEYMSKATAMAVANTMLEVAALLPDSDD